MTARPENAQTRSQLLSATDSAHSGESTMGPGGHSPLQIVARPSKISRSLDTLWPIDSQKN